MSARLIQATPANGDVIHAVPEETTTGRFSVRGALCGVRGRDAWGGGGMRPVRADGNYAANAEERVEFTVESARPASVGWNGKKINRTCPKCLRAVTKETNQ